MILSSATITLGVFEKEEEARAAIAALKEAGFTDDQIGVASKRWSKDLEAVRVDRQHTAEKGAVRGSMVGSGIGAVLGLVGGILVPGVIPIVAGSAILGLLGGAAAGAAAGAYVGPFIALGLSKEEADFHAQHVEKGRTVVLVYSAERVDDARKIMVEHGAYDESMSNP